MLSTSKSFGLLKNFHLKAEIWTSGSFRMLSSDAGEKRCKFLMVGGGSGGCAVAAKLSKNYDDIIILEPNDKHYYQPLFTLIGAGIKDLEDSYKSMKDVLPLTKAKWIQDSASEFRPDENRVVTSKHGSIKYDYLVIATGMQLNFNAIPGLVESLEDDKSNVCSIYSPKYVEKTYKCLKRTKEGKAIFTFPSSPVKCPGAPQKIMYLSEEYLRKHNLRGDNKVSVNYYTALPVLFGVKKYADSLWEVVKRRDINVMNNVNLVEVQLSTKTAVFQKLKEPDTFFTEKYELLHVSPPMGPIAEIKNTKNLVNEAGFVDVDKGTLQHNFFKNIFALGDCTNTPNSKTAAAVAAQSEILYKNLKNHLENKPLEKTYDGYASCPLVTSSSTCILAEFDYNLQPMETFPVDQGKERYSMYWMKKNAMPVLYWEMMTKGYWSGPAMMRNAMSIFKSKETSV